MKKKNVVLISSIVLAVLLVVGGTMAWFTSETKEVTNTFKTGTVDIEVNEEFDEDDNQNINPGDVKTKEVKVSNVGTKSAYIRVKLTPVWDGGKLPNEVEFHKGDVVTTAIMAYYEILNDWQLHNDGWCYYPYIVEKDSPTPNIIEEVIFAGKYMPNTYQGKQFTLKVEAEAIQASNGAALDEWGVDPSQFAPPTP